MNGCFKRLANGALLIWRDRQREWTARIEIQPPNDWAVRELVRQALGKAQLGWTLPYWPTVRDRGSRQWRATRAGLATARGAETSELSRFFPADGGGAP